MKITSLTLALLLILAAPAAAQTTVSEICPTTGQPIRGEARIVDVGDGAVLCVEDLPLLGLRAQPVAAGEQREPVQSPECLPRWRLTYPYPDATVTAEQRSALSASGPWELDAPPSSLDSEYATAENLRKALWPLPDSFEAPAWAYRSPSVPGTGRTSSGWWVIGETLRPAPPGGRSWLDLGTGEYGAQVRGAFIQFYGAPPTIGQAVQLDAHHVTGDRWWPDKRIYNAQSCEGFSRGGFVFPSNPATWDELNWLTALGRYRELGLSLRDADGSPVDETAITCHFRPDSAGCAGTTPPPPPPECVPYEGSACAVACAGKELAQDACFSLADRFPASLLAKRCNGVCRDGEEPPPPEPPTVRCYGWEPIEATLERAEFVPGVESTGLLEVKVLVRGEWVEVDCKEVG